MAPTTSFFPYLPHMAPIPIVVVKPKNYNILQVKTP
jgi:hypothetical protein